MPMTGMGGRHWAALVGHGCAASPGAGTVTGHSGPRWTAVQSHAAPTI